MSWCRSWFWLWFRYTCWCNFWLAQWCRCRFRTRLRFWCSIRYRFWLTCRSWLWYRLWFRYYFRLWLWLRHSLWLWYRLWFRHYFWFWLWYRLWLRHYFWFWYRLWLRCYFWFRLWHWLWLRNSLWLWYRLWLRCYFWFWWRLWFRHYFWLGLRVWSRVWEWLWLRCRLRITHFLKVIVHISWWFNRSRNWVVVWEWRVTFQLCISNASIWLSYLRFCNNIRITSSNQVPSVISLTRWCQWRIWCIRKWFCKSFSSLGFIVYEVYFLCCRLPTSNNKWFASSSFVNINIVVTIFAVYSCNFSLISFPLFTSFIYFTSVEECVFRYVFCTYITCAKVAYLRWIKGIEFRYSRTICIHDFRNTFHIIVVGSTLKFDQFLTDNTLTKDTRCFLSRICCSSYMLVTRDITVVWSCKLLSCKTRLCVACKICFISSRLV